MSYIKQEALYNSDSNGHDIKMIEDPNKKILAYRRFDKNGNAITCLHNFGSQEAIDFPVEVPIGRCNNKNYFKPVEIFSSDHHQYGGRHRVNPSFKRVMQGHDLNSVAAYMVRVPPQSTVVIEERVDVESCSPLSPKRGL